MKIIGRASWLVLILLIYCQPQSQQQFSAKETWSSLVRSATENNVEQFVRCIDFTTAYQRMGYSKEKALEMDRKTKANISNSEFANLAESMRGLMRIMNKGEHVVINEKEEGLDLRTLEVRSIPKKGSDIRESTDIWYFTKQNGQWLINYEVTSMKKGY